MISTAKFKSIVWDFYKEHGRHDLPWRKTRDPYRILVSEIMLQQTQVERVREYYKKFLKRFPTAAALARGTSAAVLTEWQGLGYNRRALLLKRAAEEIVAKHRGVFPRTYEELVALPGIGSATAGDILAFAWNKPALVLETNIREVYFHHYFSPASQAKALRAGPCRVHDKALLPLLEKTLDKENPREWYYALMDYGSHLKKTHGNKVSRSAHYTKQSKFAGSNRELRSKILKLVLTKSHTEKELPKLLSSSPADIKRNLLAMEKEGLLRRKQGKISA